VKTLTESVLRRLTSEVFATYLGHAARFEMVARAGWSATFTMEPTADLNYVVAGRGAPDDPEFTDACTSAISRRLPFLAILFPESGPEAERIVAELGMVHAVDFPFMVREDAPIELAGNPSVVVRRGVGPLDAEASVQILSSGFGMPEDSTRRALPPSLLHVPNLDVFLASIGDDVVGTVTVVHAGNASGIWSMATDPQRQRSGIGRRLLSTALAESRGTGPRQFFLGATPAGIALYESLGFTTRTMTSVWVSGETHQA
jgi:ribosomal protein S18 acetylase RimI-like enzyme